MKILTGKRKTIGLTMMVVGVLTALTVPLAFADEANHPGVDAFVQEHVEKLSVDGEFLQSLLANAEYKQSIIDAITRPAEAKPWRDYRKIFLTDSRIKQGHQFWQEHTDLIESVSAEYGVPPEVFLAIMGVETSYGRNTGSYKVIDALVTLGFYYEKRGAFFRGELAEFVKLADEESISIDEVTGSYAGAMGLGQFIPSSYRAYTVDFDADGRRDLWESLPDAVASVANYLNVHGWQPGKGIAMPVTVDAGAELGSYVGELKPQVTVAELREQGVQVPESMPADEKVSLFLMEGADGPEYWLGLHNFYVITRYNHSALYALAVTQLSEEIRKSRQAG